MSTEKNATPSLEKRAALLAAKVRNRHCDDRGDVNAYELARATEELLAEREALTEKVKELRVSLDDLRDVVGGFNPGTEQRAIQLRDDIWELVTR